MRRSLSPHPSGVALPVRVRRDPSGPPRAARGLPSSALVHSEHHQPPRPTPAPAAGFHFTRDVLDMRVMDLSSGVYGVFVACGASYGPLMIFARFSLVVVTELGMSPKEALSLVELVRAHSAGAGAAQRTAPSSSTALDLLVKAQRRRAISTGCAAWDRILGGGVPLAKITEFCGAPGIGKTQLA